ncbi:MAG: crotonase/enoyl-CoA hydratase family protein [Hyphomonadaceae bacterium]
MEARVTVAMQGHVADVRLARPEKMNALDDAMFAALRDVGEQLKAARGVRAIVLSGEGRAFCAGLDLGDFAAMASGGGKARLDALFGHGRRPGGANGAQHAVMVWREQPAPVIAAIHGVAFGGGLQLALGADIRVAAPEAQFSVMEAKWGLVPDMGGMALLPRLVRDDAARELVFTARLFDGTEAHRLGLVTRLSATPHAEAIALAQEIARLSPDAVRAAKRLLAVAQRGDLHETLRAESDAQRMLVGSANQIEAVRAGVEKRAADFTD